MSAASVTTEPQLYYIHTDHLGTPQELTDRDGHLQWIGQYRAWGELAKASDSEGNAANVEMPLRFQGQYCDAETGLHYNRFRYYDPQVGRFTTQDPISPAGGLNLYQYAPNPVQWVDPLGLSPMSPCPHGNGSNSRPDFYVGPAGPSATMPSTAYRYTNSTDSYASKTLSEKYAPLSYFGYTKYNSGSEARNAYQVFYEKGNSSSWSDARLRREFDTLQLYKKGTLQVKLPMATRGKGPGEELFASTYPQYGKEGPVQLLPMEKELMYILINYQYCRSDLYE